MHDIDFQIIKYAKIHFYQIVAITTGAYNHPYVDR